MPPGNLQNSPRAAAIPGGDARFMWSLVAALAELLDQARRCADKRCGAAQQGRDFTDDRHSVYLQPPYRPAGASIAGGIISPIFELTSVIIWSGERSGVK